MVHRIEVIHKIPDARAKVKKVHLQNAGFRNIDKLSIVDVYTIDASLSRLQLNQAAGMIANPLTQDFKVDEHNSLERYDWAIEVGFLPGVTDNIGTTATESIRDLLKDSLPSNARVYTSSIFFLSGNLKEEEVKKIAEQLGNPLINRFKIQTYNDFLKNKEVYVPKVRLDSSDEVSEVRIIDVSDNELIKIGKEGIPNPDGTTRGPLSLDLVYMKTIQDYFKKKGRNPTDIELESIAQTWSEHCKHTIFADPLDEIKDGLYKSYIKEATNKIRQKKGKEDFCVSVFTDNAGAIEFDKDYLVTDKVETHNSPSALDPFGGSITGIVGVNRDAMGFGIGAKPILNRYGFCFANPNDNVPLYRKSNMQDKMLSPKMIMDGVIAGVNSGGNCSGIPTPQGFVYFDDRYKGKPLVFVGTLGLIPKKVEGKESYRKSAKPGDYIVMVGGRVGQDGIHGATFSSEALTSGSPATAVQIGDPITQKKMSDAIVKEARELGLYNSITDNGAGGLSCSVAEMARECGGCKVKLESVPLKYPGLEPWKIWISESQERMTLAVPKNKWKILNELLERRGVEATIIGEFTDSGKCVVEYKNKVIMYLEMDFLHNGLPKKDLRSNISIKNYEEPSFVEERDLTNYLLDMLKRLNVGSFAFISNQYDHEVQGGSVIKPLQGKGRVNGSASVIRPLLNSYKGVVVSQGINPSYSDIDTYHMAACAIDSAIRNAVCAGANPKKIAILDNFCWCSSNDPERLWELKAAVRACYDYAIAYDAPFISGKDSMFNDFKGFNEKNEQIKISIPPTLLISSIGIAEDVRKCITLDAKLPGDLVYVLGDTYQELGGSEYFAMIGEKIRNKRYIGNSVPKVDSKKNSILYQLLHKAIDQELISSACSVNAGGLGIALAKKSIAGDIGMEIDLNEEIRKDFLLFSESQGRVIVTINPKNKERFEDLMRNISMGMIGRIREDKEFLIRSNGNDLVKTNISRLREAYKSTFGGQSGF